MPQAMTHINFRIALTAASLLALIRVDAQNKNVAINNTGAAAAPSAILDINWLSSGPPSTPKGFLAPRMAYGDRILIAAPVDGLLVYQNTASGLPLPDPFPVGFYVYYNSTWNYLLGPDDAWKLRGNSGTNPNTPIFNALGTNNNYPLGFRTLSAERMRIETDGNVGMGLPPVPAAAEKLDVYGAIKLTSTSATNGAGTIRWNAAGYLEGNKDGTGTGWVKLPNDYNEVNGATYWQASIANCSAANTSAIIGPWTTNVLPTPTPLSPATVATPLTAGDYAVVPWVLTASNFIRSRHQYLIRASELNVEGQQWGGNWNYTQGLCANTRVDSIAFYVAATPAGGAKTVQALNVTLRHTQTAALSAGFASMTTPVDPALACGSYGILTIPASPAIGTQPSAGAGWKWYRLSSPFYWNGADNILLEFCWAATGSNPSGSPTFWVTPSVGYNCTFGLHATSGAGVCGQQNSGGCSTVSYGCGMDATCAGTAGTQGGLAQYRPVIQFGGQGFGAATAGTGPVPPTTGRYISYKGGLVVEAPGCPCPPLGPGPTWSTNTTASPAPGNYYSFKGRGRISAQKGVYDYGVRLNDHVLDRYFDGRVQPGDADVFGDQRYYGMNEMVNYVEQERHLPTMRGREAWNREGGFSLGDASNQLWATAETQALYLTELNDQLAALRMLSTDEPLAPKDMEKVRQAIGSMSTLTEAEKVRLIKSCEMRVQNGATGTQH